MSVDLNTVRRIAHLARIAVSEAETPHLQDEINAILKFVEALDTVDVDGVEPMTSVIPMRLPMRAIVSNIGRFPASRSLGLISKRSSAPGGSTRLSPSRRTRRCKWLRPAT